MISHLLVFGASGDLTGRHLLPALGALADANVLPDDFELVGGATQDWDDAAFRVFADERLQTHAPQVAASTRNGLLDRLRYRTVDVTDPESVEDAVAVASGGGPDPAPIAVYLSLPVHLIASTVTALASASLPVGSRIVIEKPFGEDLASAVALNSLVEQVTDGGRVDTFRVDHALGMEPLWNLLGMRRNDRMLQSAWNGARIAQVGILWEETLALEGRVAYFDGAGVLRDVMQNHMMQVLSIVAMEEPADAAELGDRKVEVLRAIPTLSAEKAAERSHRGRYTAGRLADDPDGGGRSVPSYIDEDGVDPARQTETFAEVALDINTPLWRGTRFVLRAGKALAARRKGVLVHFRPGREGSSDAAATRPGSRLWIGVDGPNDVRWEVAGMRSPNPGDAMTVALDSPPVTAQLPPYAHVLRDVLHGGSALSVRGDEAEEAWRIVEPVLDAWRGDLVPLQDYPAGSAGPVS